MTDIGAGLPSAENPKLNFNALEHFSSLLPSPASAIVELARNIIVASQNVPSHRDEAGHFKVRLLRVLPLVVSALYDPSSGDQRQSAIPDQLKIKADHFFETLNRISRDLSGAQSISTAPEKRRKVKSTFVATPQTALFERFSVDLRRVEEDFDCASRLTAAINLCNVPRRVQRILPRDLLNSLPRAKYAGFDCERPDHPSNCLQGTRTDLLKMIVDWICDTDPTVPRLFWLYGIAGVGKTTVARTIAEAAKRLGLLGAHFFFSRSGEAELRNPALVFTTIAYQLASLDQEFNRCITEALNASPDSPYASLKEQLDQLIVAPLVGITPSPGRVVVLVLDAFDECEARGAKSILKLLIAAISSLPFFLKILITSRPETHIRSLFIPATTTPQPGLQMTALHDIESSVVQGDIRLYLRHHLHSLGEERGIGPPQVWVTDSDIELLVQTAGNLFIYASIAIQFLSKGFDPRSQLKVLLEIIRSPNHSAGTANPFMDLDKLYRNILLGLVPPENYQQATKELRTMLGSVVLLRDPLPIAALDRLLGSGTIYGQSILQHLHSVVLIPPPPDDCPRIFHPSFPDFLQDRNRCLSDDIWIDTRDHEGLMAIRSLNLLNTKLHKGMLGDLGPALLNSEVAGLATKIKDGFSLELQYACRFWASHLAATPSSNAEVRAALEIFALTTMLPWMEAMSWLGETDLAITCLRAANSWLTAIPTPSRMKALLYDGHRLLLAHSSTISLGAQHLARSVLPFSPPNVALTACYRSYSGTTVRVIQGVDPEWSPLLMVWTGHSDAVNSVGFAPDGSRAASGSNDGTIRMWDPITGACTTTIEGHSNRVNSIAFHPDGTYLASGSDDESIRLWDVITGDCIAILTGHPGWVTCVAFSQNGSALASGSEDKTIRLWDTTSCTCATLFTGHLSTVLSIGFAADGLRLASGSEDLTVRIWDTLTGSCTATVGGFACAVRSVVFSPDGSCLAFGSGDQTIRTWNVAENSWMRSYAGHTEGVNSVTFSSDGCRLATGSVDETVRVWDTTTGACIVTFRGHSNPILSIAFSPDGSSLISGSVGGTVRLWDAAVTDSIHREGHSNQVVSLAFSRDGMLLASGSRDHTARIWDITSGLCIATLEGHSADVNTVVFHPNASHLATESDDETIRIWDVTTGGCTAMLECPGQEATALAFSNDGTCLKYEDALGVTYAWDVSAGQRVREADGRHSGDPVEQRFEIEQGRLFRIVHNGPEDLVCFLPPWAPPMSDSVTSFKLGEGHDLVAIGCWNGTVFILEISSS